MKIWSSKFLVGHQPRGNQSLSSRRQPQLQLKIQKLSHQHWRVGWISALAAAFGFESLPQAFPQFPILFAETISVLNNKLHGTWIEYEEVEISLASATYHTLNKSLDP